MGKGGLTGTGLVLGALAGIATGGLAWAPALAGAAIGGILGQTGDTSIDANRESHRQKGIQQEQQRQIKKEEALALEQRKRQIDAQRAGMRGASASTSGTSTSGLTSSTNSTQTLG